MTWVYVPGGEYHAPNTPPRLSVSHQASKKRVVSRSTATSKTLSLPLSSQSLRKTLAKTIKIDQPLPAVLEIIPSKVTSNDNVRWLLAEFARLYRPLQDRISIDVEKKTITYTPEITIWWEIVFKRGQVKFYLVIPDKSHIKQPITKQVMNTWKQATIVQVADYLPRFDVANTSITGLTLKYHPVLSLAASNPTISFLGSLLDVKHYVRDDDIAILQIGIRPRDSSWPEECREILVKSKQTGQVPAKKAPAPLTTATLLRSILSGGLYLSGRIVEETINFIMTFLFGGDWEDERPIMEANQRFHGVVNSNNTHNKWQHEGFDTDIRCVVQSKNVERRKSITRAIVASFDKLKDDNELIPVEMPANKISFYLRRIRDRQFLYSKHDTLSTLELSKIINVPDKRAQAEHYNELHIADNRGGVDVPKGIFEPNGIPFGTYEDTDGKRKLVYLSNKDLDLFNRTIISIGDTGSGKTTFAANFALDAFTRGYGMFVIDAADGRLVQRILDRVPPEKRGKVKIIDFLNTEYPVGLGWNEIFGHINPDVAKEALVEEIETFIRVVSNTELNMRARQWVENAIKAVYASPDATLQDVENMLNNAQYREKVIPTIQDPKLRHDWEHYHNNLSANERRTIYDEAFRRLAPVMRNDLLKLFILQPPKKNEKGEYLIDFRKWMDEGYLVLVKANESLQPRLQTALVSFLLAKFNLAIISREDIPNENDRHPCFLILDEPDHYIKGSERWRNMLTRYRKYRCGLIFLFHGWDQLTETDSRLPNMIRKAGPHYVIFQTDEENVRELRYVIEPEFSVQEVAKGMPRYHAVVRLRAYANNGSAIPAFMIKSLDVPEKRFARCNNDDLYQLCAQELGTPKQEVLDTLFSRDIDAEFSMTDLITQVSAEGEGEIREEKERVKFSAHREEGIRPPFRSYPRLVSRFREEDEDD